MENLLRLIIENNFGLFITVDRNLVYQQNLQRFTSTIVVLRANNNTTQTLRLLIPKMFESIAKGDLPNVIEVA